VKYFIKKFFNSLGFEIKRLNPQPQIGSDKRPVGQMDLLLEDLKFRGLKCQLIMDVGANRTYWSRMTKRIFPTANFCLIEPQIEMQNDLEIFCKEFPDSVFFLAGAGEKEDTLTLTIWDDLAGSSLLPLPNNKLENEGKQRKINILKIDNLISSGKIKMPNLIKIDVQGFELEVLKGATKTFGDTEVFILETSLFSFDDIPGVPSIADVINFMLERNYVIYDFPGFLRRPLDGALAQCDICFVKQNGFLRRSHKWK